MIIRRRLFTYTVLFTTGISAGFFIFERSRPVGCFLVMASAGAVICIAAGSDACMRRRLIAWMAAGFLLFTCRYIHYGTSLDSGNVMGESAIQEIVSVEGFAESVIISNGKLKVTLRDTDVLRNNAGVLVSIREYEDYDPAELIGRRIKAYGKLREVPAADNPGCFDYRIYLRSKGVVYLFSAKALIADDDSITLYGRYRKRLYLCRKKFLELFDDDTSRSFIKGTVFGDKSDIDEDVREEFSMNGTGHILAVSGLHTGFLYALLRLITGKKRTLPATAVTIAVLLLYGEMTMWSPSAMRAVTVLSVSLMSIWAKRPFDLLSAVSAAALLILVREPYQLFSTGFQLSFTALLGICFLAGPLKIFIGEWLAVPVAVQAAVLPLTGYVFHRINVLSVFINIPVIFMASVLVPACMTALMISLASGTVPHVMITVIEGLTDVVIRFNSATAAGGLFSDLVSAGGPVSAVADLLRVGEVSGYAAAVSTGMLLMMYLVIFLVTSEWFRIRLLRQEKRTAAVAVACACVVSICLGMASYNAFADDEIVFVSVGQGDCTHIRAGGKDILIDGGGSSERDIGKDVLMPYMLSNGAEKAEMCLVTHLHADHYLGIAQLADVYPVGVVGIPEDYRRAVEDQLAMSDEDRQKANGYSEAGYSLPDRIEYVEQGSKIMITDDVYIEPIWPLRGSGSGIDIDDPNENNMVYMAYYNGIKIMITGDLLEEDELEMIRYYKGTDVLDCDILKVAHHGSKSSSSVEFLDAASPDIAVIQVGANNFYGHPHQQTLDRLEERGIRVYRTDLNGAVGIDIKGNRLKVDVMSIN